MVRSTPVGNTIKLSLKSEQPLKLNYSIGDASVTYFLAPYVEE